MSPEGFLVTCIVMLNVVNWFSDWFESKAFRVGEHEYPGEFKWITWGYQGGWFLFGLKLPSYTWQTELMTREDCWHQWRISWSNKPSFSGWRIDAVPVRDKSHGAVGGR